MKRLAPCTSSSNPDDWRGRKELIMPAAEDDRNAVPLTGYAGIGSSRAESPHNGAPAFGQGGIGCGGRLERITVNLTGRASRALELAAELTGDTKTDTVNRALQIYAYVEQVMAAGGSVRVRAAGTELDLLKYR
jgi:hypothetical protein